MNYRPVRPPLIAALREIVGAENLLVSAEEIEPYTHDEVIGLRAEPEVVVRVTTAQQVSQILQLAQKERVPVTPRGAGMGLSGGGRPGAGGLKRSLVKIRNSEMRDLPAQAAEK